MAAAEAETDSQRSERAGSMYRNIKISSRNSISVAQNEKLNGKEREGRNSMLVKANKLVVKCLRSGTWLPYCLGPVQVTMGLLPWRSRSTVLRIVIYYDNYRRSEGWSTSYVLEHLFWIFKYTLRFMVTVYSIIGVSHRTRYKYRIVKSNRTYAW